MVSGIGARRAGGVKTKTPKRNPPKRDMGGRGQTKTETLLSSVSLALVLGGTCITKSGRGEDEAQAASASSIAADLPTDSRRHPQDTQVSFLDNSNNFVHDFSPA